MGILKYHPTSLISYERGWPLACLEDLIKPNQASISHDLSHGVPLMGSLTLVQKVIPGYLQRTVDFIAELACGLFPMIFRMLFPSWAV
jgi:hypothetical protein